MREITGEVISTKMSKTAKVAVERLMPHPLYKKRMKRVRNYLVHDEIGVKVGDIVSFVDAKPYSKNKRWKIVKVLEEADSGGKKKKSSKKKSNKKKKSKKKGSKK